MDFLRIESFSFGSIVAFLSGVAYIFAIGYMIIKPLSLSTVPVEHGASRRVLKSVRLKIDGSPRLFDFEGTE